MAKSSDMSETATLTAELSDTGPNSITKIPEPASQFVIRSYNTGEYEVTSNRRIKGFTMDVTPTQLAGTELYVNKMHIVVEMYPSTGGESASKAVVVKQERPKALRRLLQFLRIKRSPEVSHAPAFRSQ